MTGFFHLVLWSQGSFMFQHVLVLHSFLLPSNILCCMKMPHCVIRSSADGYLSCLFILLWIILLWLSVYMFLYEWLFSIFLSWVQLLQSFRLCNPMDCSPPGSSVHAILQERILEWVAVSSSRGSSPPKDCRWRLYHWATREALSIFLGISFFGGDSLAIYAGVFAALHGLSLAVMSRGYSLVVLHGLLTAVASLVAEHGL